MVRPRKLKWISFQPDVTYFKPRGVPLAFLDEVTLNYEELEALRLSNLEKLNQTEASKKMNVHQSTFQRTLARAEEKITNALVNGKAIKICGGRFTMPAGDGTGPIGQGRGQGRMAGQGRGRMGGFAAGPSGVCKCPKCGYEQPHVRGQPCTQIKCPKCQSIMTRG